MWHSMAIQFLTCHQFANLILGIATHCHIQLFIFHCLVSLHISWQRAANSNTDLPPTGQPNFRLCHPLPCSVNNFSSPGKFGYKFATVLQIQTSTCHLVANPKSVMPPSGQIDFGPTFSAFSVASFKNLTKFFLPR